MTIHSLQQFFVHHRVRVGFFIFIALILEWLSHAQPHSLLSAQTPLPASGALLAIAGALLRSWAAGIVEKKTALTTQGPYALTRHPLYLGSFAIMLGFTLILEDKLAFAVTLAVILFIYIPTIRNEERMLAQRFREEWRCYTAATGMFAPHRWQSLAAPWTWARWRHHREYRALLLTLAALALFEFWARHTTA